MASVRGYLVPGTLYQHHDRKGRDHCIECIQSLPLHDSFSPYTALVRSTITGWTMIIHGINVYSDGTIDWDFSTDGHWTEKDSDGVLHEKRW